MISVEHLTKRYPARTAVSDVSFEVKKGEVVGFLGPNGAGKSTTLRMITGFLPPTDGRISVGGFDVLEQSVEARRLIGYMPEAVPLYGEMRVTEYLAYRAKIKGVGRGEREKSINRALEMAAVADVRDRIIGQLSKGYKQRVGLADALVANPPILVLDEPTAGLDPNQIRQVRELVKQLGKEHTLFLSTHILPEVEATCERVLIINRGRLVGEGAPDTLRAQLTGSKRYALEIKGEPSKVHELLAKVPGITRIVDVKPVTGRVEGFARARVEADPNVDVGVEIFAAVRDAGLVLRELHLEAASLEDIFAQLTVAEDEDDAKKEDDAKDDDAKDEPSPRPSPGGEREPGPDGDDAKKDDAKKDDDVESKEKSA
ncbi:MAG: ABC transporter ATP-binding protein [Deltaproteobacteria bacterium]|nr:ABC transporter ATP-binding protein [Deltaproteobacteria bacterium]